MLAHIPTSTQKDTIGIERVDMGGSEGGLEGREKGQEEGREEKRRKLVEGLACSFVSSSTGQVGRVKLEQDGAHTRP